MKKFLPFLIFLFLGIYSQAQYKRSKIGFGGYLQYSLDFRTKTGSIKIPQVKNDRYGGKSGTLYLEVWLMEKKYKGNLRYEGYNLASLRLEALLGGYHYTDLKYDINWDLRIPSQKYYVVFLLKEYDPQGYTAYTLSDYLCFDQQVDIDDVY